MNFELSHEQQLLIATTQAFVEQELYPYEAQVEHEDQVAPELISQIQHKAQEVGLFAANLPEEVGGGGLSVFDMTLLDRELGRANFALHYLVARPSNILMACNDRQREQYLYPCVRGEKIDCLAMTEPDAGSDLRGMKCKAEQAGDDFIINGSKHFISHADLADFVILFAATDSEQTARGTRQKITAFLVDKGTLGFTVRAGYHSVSHRGYHNCILEFTECRIPASQVLGELHQGFEVANNWLGPTRLQVAACCLGRAERALNLAQEWAATRQQFGQPIGKFQGVGFKLADMKTRLEAATLLTLQAAWKTDQGSATDLDYAMAKLYSTEALAFIADEALQIHGGMGLMSDLPLERIWRDARVERIWEGTSEIQRHIIARDLLRPYWT